MTVDEGTFFREATLLICGNLDIEKAMVEFLRYLRKFMPADRLILEQYDEKSGSLRVVGHATPERGTKGDAYTPLSHDAQDHVARMYRKGAPEPYYENNPNEHPGARESLAFHGQQASAFLELPLITSSGQPGGIVLLTERS